MELHPSPTAREGNVPNNAVTKGISADKGPFQASKEVWCTKCGFRCNLERDAKNTDEFAGEIIEKGFIITDHAYSERGDDIYDGQDRTTEDLSVELSNGSFESWTAGNPDDWTVSGTVTQETTAGFFDWTDGGVSSAKIIRSGSDISLSQAMSTPSDFNDNFLRFRVRVKSSTNEVIRLRVDINSVTYYSFYNVSQQRYQDILLSQKCPATVSSLTVYILADLADGTAYIDSAILARDGNPTTVTIQAACPHCGSYNYFNRLEPLTKKAKTE